MNNILNLAADSIIGLTEAEKEVVLHEVGHVLPGLIKDVKDAVEIHGYTLPEALAEMTHIMKLDDDQVTFVSNLAAESPYAGGVVLLLFWSAVVCCFNHMGLPLSAIKKPAVN